MHLNYRHWLNKMIPVDRATHKVCCPQTGPCTGVVIVSGQRVVVAMQVLIRETCQCNTESISTFMRWPKPQVRGFDYHPPCHCNVKVEAAYEKRGGKGRRC